MKKGIDVSHHQGNINFSMVKSNGVEFVIIREGYRDSTDKKFFENVQKAKEVDLPILAVYHFAYALNEEEAREEAKLCIENMNKAELGNNVMVFYDFEYDTVNKAAQKGVVLDPSHCNAHTLAFCEEIKKLGFEPGIYTNLDYYKNWYCKDTLSRYDIWLADYTNGPDFKCVIQQYSNKGLVPGIEGNVDLDYYYDEVLKMIIQCKEIRSRSDVVNLASSWIGKNETDGSYKEIIDIYNSFNGPLPRRTRMRYDWAWCACTWSALSIALGYTDIMPIEISCGELIKKAQDLGIWQENDGYVPLPGDGIVYNWDDKGDTGDNTGWPDHIGVVDYCNQDSGYMTVIEGNYDGAVKKRTISINGKYIRGFITPKYNDNTIINQSSISQNIKDVETLAREVIAGLWGNDPDRKEAIEKNGFDYEAVKVRVNEILNGPAATKPISIDNALKEVKTTCYAKSEDTSLAGTYVTTANLYCRNDAGTNKKALCKIPKGTTVHNYGFYTMFNGVKWLLIQAIVGGIKYTGFSSSEYLKK